MFLGFQGQESFIEFGTSNPVQYSNNPRQAVVLSVDKNYFWQSKAEGFSVGTPSENAYKTPEFDLIFDTGNSIILTPAFLGTALIDQILEGRPAWHNNGYYFTDCSLVGL